MNDESEEFTVPTETQGYAVVRRAGLIVFIGAAVILFAVAIVSLASK